MGFEYALRYNLIKNKGSYMEYEEFKKILKENNLTIKDFSKLAGISYRTCNNWAKPQTKVSDWVKPFLTLYIENQRLKALKNDDCEEYKKALAKALQDNINQNN